MIAGVPQYTAFAGVKQNTLGINEAHFTLPAPVRRHLNGSTTLVTTDSYSLREIKGVIEDVATDNNPTTLPEQRKALLDLLRQGYMALGGNPELLPASARENFNAANRQRKPAAKPRQRARKSIATRNPALVQS